MLSKLQKLVKRKNYLVFAILGSVFLGVFLIAIVTNPVIPCKNPRSYITPTDLLDSYHFILQQEAKSQVLNTLLSEIPYYTNCLNLDRGDLDEQNSGYAVFVPYSSLTRLRLDIDFLYRSTDPVLTGYLLVGKLARANDFILSRSDIKQSKCTVQNLHDVQAQLAYLTTLNTDQRNSLAEYINKQIFSVKDTITKKILTVQLEAVSQCQKNNYSCDKLSLDFPKTHNLVLDSENQCF